MWDTVIRARSGSDTELSSVLYRHNSYTQHSFLAKVYTKMEVDCAVHVHAYMQLKYILYICL